MLDKRIDDCSRAFWQNGLMTTVADARPAFAHVTDWVFDLDNTLYPRGCNLFAQIDLLISDYMVTVTGLPYAEARALQKAYYRDHGTTLHGLMLHHGVDPDHFLRTVHAIDYSGVAAHPALATLGQLPYIRSRDPRLAESAGNRRRVRSRRPVGRRRWSCGRRKSGRHPSHSCRRG